MLFVTSVGTWFQDELSVLSKWEKVFSGPLCGRRGHTVLQKYNTFLFVKTADIFTKIAIIYFYFSAKLCTQPIYSRLPIVWNFSSNVASCWFVALIKYNILIIIILAVKYLQKQWIRGSYGDKISNVLQNTPKQALSLLSISHLRSAIPLDWASEISCMLIWTSSSNTGLLSWFKSFGYDHSAPKTSE